MEWANIRFFDPSEFDSPDWAGSGYQMDMEFIGKLDRARFHSQVPFIINSGVRTHDYNKRIGGVKNSSHLIKPDTQVAHAADIRVNNSGHRHAILTALIDQGFTRFGIGRTFIHVDNDPDKTPGVIWDYYPKRNFFKALFFQGQKVDI